MSSGIVLARADRISASRATAQSASRRVIVRFLMSRLILITTVLASSMVCLLGPSSPANAQTTYTKCQNVVVAKIGIFVTARHVAESHSTCATADGLAVAYYQAISSTTKGNTTRQGTCYPEQAYGSCEFVYQRGVYECFHYGALPKATHGLVRCRRNGARYEQLRIGFNIGF
jgi:hypothetical protein